MLDSLSLKPNTSGSYSVLPCFHLSVWEQAPAQGSGRVYEASRFPLSQAVACRAIMSITLLWGPSVVHILGITFPENCQNKD